MAGAMAQLVLFGFTLSHLINLRSTNTWLKSSNGTRAICWAVLLLNTAFTGMIAHDVWHYGTYPLRGLYDIIAGTLVQAVEPMLLGVIAIVVQLTLGWRSSRVSARLAKHTQSPWSKGRALCLAAVGSWSNGVKLTSASLLSFRRSSSDQECAGCTSSASELSQSCPSLRVLG